MSIEIQQSNFGADRHPDENQLLFRLEGELPAAEIAEVERHLAACWDCRARYHEMQRGILAFVEYREKIYLPELEAAPRDFGQFRSLLKQAAAESPKPGFLTRFRSLYSFASVSLPAKWASVTAGILTVVLLWTQVLSPTSLSASKLLIKAVQSQNPPGAIHRKVRQKIRMKTAGKEVIREFQWETGSPIPGAQWGTDPENWTAPMTAQGFSDWHDLLAGPTDRVTKSGDVWTLDTVAPGGPIREASIVIHQGDFHPTEQHIRFSDDRRLDLEEVDFQIAGQAPASASPSSPVAPPARTGVTTRSEDRGPAPSVSSAVDLDEAELQLRYTMFVQHLDEDEDLQISRAVDAVVVSGIVSSPDRLRELQTSLGALPGVRLSVTEPDLAAVNPAATPSQKTANSSPVPLLKDRLDSAFDSAAARRDFVDGCLSDADSALSNAWALKKLVERYTVADRRTLKPESAVKLDEMMRRHIEEIGAANSKLETLLNLLPPSRLRRIDTPQDFRAGVSALFDLIQRQDSIVAALVAGTQTAETAASASDSLRSVHEAIGRLDGELKPRDGNTPK